MGDGDLFAEAARARAKLAGALRRWQGDCSLGDPSLDLRELLSYFGKI